MEQTEDSFDEIAETSVTCAICMCDLEPTDYLYNLKCHHVFHVDCLEKWYSRRNRCPICRQPIDFIVTTQDHYTFDRAAFEASLKEQAKEMEKGTSIEMSAVWAVSFDSISHSIPWAVFFIVLLLCTGTII